MPIFVTNYHWDQSSEYIYLRILLQGAKKTSVNILQSANYIKVSFPPYIFEKPTWAKVNPDETFVKIENGTVNVRLKKTESKEWLALSADIPIEKSDAKMFMAKLREEAVEFSIKDAEQKREERIADKNKKDRFAVSQQIKLEQGEKKRIEDFKNEEKKKVTDELLAFQKTAENESGTEQNEELKRQWEHYQKLEAELKEIDSDEDEKRAIDETKLGMQTNTSNSNDAENVEGVSENRKTKQKSVVESYLKQNRQIFDSTEISQPAIRGSGKNIQISFTPRVFPTPLRESRKPEEDEWLRKQAEARQRAVANSEELTEVEKDPVLLRQKGNNFFKQENYQGAVNVFTHAINLYPKMPELYSNRAACHLKLRNFFKALDDSSKAIDLLTPACEANATDRTKAHIRRGTAFCELECYAEGLIEYEAALKCDPTNEQISQDCEKLRNYIQGTYEGDLRTENPYMKENKSYVGRKPNLIVDEVQKKGGGEGGSSNDSTSDDDDDEDDDSDGSGCFEDDLEGTKENRQPTAVVHRCEESAQVDSDDMED